MGSVKFKDLKAYVRYDGNGRVVAGSMVFRKKKPKNGRWYEISSNLCCNPGGNSTTTTTTIVPTTTTSTTVAPTTTTTSTNVAQITGYRLGQVQYPDSGTSCMFYSDINDGITLFAPGGPYSAAQLYYDPQLTMPYTGNDWHPIMIGYPSGPTYSVRLVNGFIQDAQYCGF